MWAPPRSVRAGPPCDRSEPLLPLGHILAENRGHANTPYLALGVGVFSALAFSPAGVILGRNGAIVTYSAFLLALAIKMLTA